MNETPGNHKSFGKTQNLSPPMPQINSAELPFKNHYYPRREISRGPGARDNY